MQAPTTETLTRYGWADKIEIRIPSRMIRSRAFIELSNTAKLVLLLFLQRRKWFKDGKGKNKRTHYNTRGLRFTYTEAEKVWGILPRTFRLAIIQLIRNGFIEVEVHGGTLQGNRVCTEYKLVDTWQKYGEPGYMMPSIPPTISYNDSFKRLNAERTKSRKSEYSTDNNVSRQLTKSTAERVKMDV